MVDYFNPNIDKYLQKYLKGDMTKTGFYLDHNIPDFERATYNTGPENDPFYYLPYWPGSRNKLNHTLPSLAAHVTGYVDSEP